MREGRGMLKSFKILIEKEKRHNFLVHQEQPNYLKS